MEMGTQSFSEPGGLRARPGIQIVAVRDPNRNTNDYVEWGKGSIRNTIRGWRRRARSSRCSQQSQFLRVAGGLAEVKANESPFGCQRSREARPRRATS